MEPVQTEVISVHHLQQKENHFQKALGQRTMSSPWGKTPGPVVPCSLEEVMSEQLADQLQHSEIASQHDAPSNENVDFQALVAAAAMESGITEDTSNDQVLAQMLQAEFDKEHDRELQVKEKKYNGSNKVSISFNNYRQTHPENREDDEDVLDEDYEGEMNWENNKPPAFRAGGISGKGKNITTKHDAVICGRRNASRLMEFPPEFESGDGEGMDMQLPNHVYNKLKLHTHHENKRSHKLHEKKEHSTAEHAMDARTRLQLYKMVNKGALESISGSISTGKESVVFHAFGGELNGDALSKECAIKVFKTTLNEFKNRERYVHGDHRFSKDDFKKQNPRKIIKMWAMKETANLNRMQKFNIPCPRVQFQKKHILVMSFIGEDQTPAPKLKEASLSPAEWEDAFHQTVMIMKNLQENCHLVHADLSEYNMLWFKDMVWIIDVSQAVDITHPTAMEFLHRDCTNIVNFFTSRGVHAVPTPEALFNDITGLDISGEGADFLSQVRRYDTEKTEEYLACQIQRKNYAFDFFFDKALKERAAALQGEEFSDSEEEQEAVSKK